MSETEAVNTLVQTGGGAGGIIALLFVLRKVWMDLSKSRVDTHKDNAEVTVVETLRQEVKRLAEELREDKEEFKQDIEDMKQSHSKERLELLSRISELESQLKALKDSHASLKQEALKVYMLVSSADKLCENCDFTELKNQLMNLILHVESPQKDKSDYQI